MARTTHAEHFLSRIDRLNTRHAELALGLYRDHELVRYLLGKAKVGDSVERVAISLGDADRGPYVIVTRDGKFVTCLGEGMSLHDDQALITRSTLDMLGGRVEALRTLLDDSSQGKRRHCDHLLQRVLEAGQNVTQREFDDLLTWSPFAGHLYVRALLTTVDSLGKRYARLKQTKHIGKRSEPLLRAYWQSLWASLHLTSLVGAQPEHLERAFELLDAAGHAPDLSRRLFIMPLWKTGLFPWAMRASWLASRLPKAFLKPLKVAYDGTELGVGILGYGASLAAIGYRHQRYQAEIRKFMHRPETQPMTPLDEVRRVTGSLLTRPYDPEVRAEFEGLPQQGAEALFEPLAEQFDDLPEIQSLIGEMDTAAKLAMMFTLPLALQQQQSDFERILLYLPAVSIMNARDFYIPARFRPVLLTRIYRRDVALAYVAPRFEEDKRSKPPPRRAVEKPRRNDPCSCGSGKKYKRCCAEEQAGAGASKPSAKAQNRPDAAPSRGASPADSV